MALFETHSLSKELDTTIALPFDEPRSITRLVTLPDDALSGACVAKAAADCHKTGAALGSERELASRDVRSVLHSRDGRASTRASRTCRSCRTSRAGLALLLLSADAILSLVPICGSLQTNDSSGVARDAEQ